MLVRSLLSFQFQVKNLLISLLLEYQLIKVNNRRYAKSRQIESGCFVIYAISVLCYLVNFQAF